MIIGPGETAGRIEQPAIGSITNAASYRAGLQYGFGKTHRAKRRRRKCRTAANRDAERIYAGRQRRPGRERCVNLATDENPVGQHIIVAALNPGEEAAAFVEGVECLKQIGRTVDVGTRRPIRASPRHAEVTAGVESGPVVGRRVAVRYRWGLRHHGVVGRGAARQRDDGGANCADEWTPRARGSRSGEEPRKFPSHRAAAPQFNCPAKKQTSARGRRQLLCFRTEVVRR